jgi:hypothetical protein
MKKVIILLSLVIFCLSSQAQNQGIGIRIGEPMGLTYKKYFGRTKALEVGLGSAALGWNNAYYRNSFDARNEFEDYDYRSHTVRSIVYLQGRYLLHNEIYVQGMVGKWDWYWGLGGLLKFANVRYRFFDEAPPFAETEVYNDIDFGPEGIAGMEYTFEDAPITAFGEVSLLLEVVDRFTLRPFGALGVRYNFR